MNPTMRNLNYNNILFFDIETASAEKELNEDSPFFKIFRWKHRDKETDKLLSIKATKDLYSQKAALDPISGKIVAATCGFCNGETISLKSFQGEETDIISGLLSILTKDNRIIGGYNNIAFDHPFLRKRHAILKMGEFPSKIDDSGKKSWDMAKHVVDIMEIFRGSGYINHSLDEMCWAFGVPSPKNGDVKGSEVSKVFWEGGIDKIVSYNESDVRSTINLFRVLKGDKIIE